MKILLATATALTMSGAALAWQTTGTGTTATTTDTGVAVTTQQGMVEHHAHLSLDPTMTLQPQATWTTQQRTMWDQHMANLPTHWTEQQRAMYRQGLATAPAQWTPEMRTLYTEHYTYLPTNWTAEQRSAYNQQMAAWRTPWMGHQAAATGTTWNEQNRAVYDEFAGMGGPYEEVYGEGFASLQPRPADTNYPPCSPGPGDDRCIQLYEPGVRQALASWNRATGGLAGGAEVGMGGPYEEADDTND